MILAVTMTLAGCGREVVLTPAAENGTEPVAAVPLFLENSPRVEKTEITDVIGTRVILGKPVAPLKLTLRVAEQYGDQSLQIEIRDRSLAEGLLQIVNDYWGSGGIQAEAPERAFIEASVDAGLSGPFLWRIDSFLESRGLSVAVGVDDNGNHYFGKKEVTRDLKVWFGFPRSRRSGQDLTCRSLY
jgi:hypothetical protein